MAELNKIYTEKNYYAKFENDVANIPADFKGLGYYQRTSLEDVINNFVVAYIGDDKILAKVPEYEVAFWAQRGLQEFSYDVLHSEKSIEVELNPARQIPLPQDYVSYVKVSCVDKLGNKKPLLPGRKTGNPTAPLQDSDYDYTYDADGNIEEASASNTISRFQDPDVRDVNLEANDYYRNNYNDDNFDYFNKKFGANPEHMSAASTFYIDKVNGVIFFDGGVKQDELIVLDYISDGLSDDGDLSKVYVPKLAEDALYAYMLYNLAKLRPSAAPGVALYKKEASAKMRNTKIRLTNYKSEEMAQVLRGKSKWIKH